MTSGNESRTIRPYDHLEDAEEAFAQITLSCGQRVASEGDSTERLTDDEFWSSPIILNLASDEEQFQTFKDNLMNSAKKLNIDPTDLQLLVVTTGLFFRISDVVHSISLAEMSEKHRELRLVESKEQSHERWASTQNASHGFDVNVYCVLNKDLPRRPLHPSRKGTWLAKTQFKVRTKPINSDYETLALNDDVRQKHGLVDKNILKFCHIDTDPADPSSQWQDIHLYVEEKLLALLKDNESNPEAQIILKQLGLDLLSAIVTESSLKLDNRSIEEIRDSILHLLIKKVAGDDEAAQELYLKMIATTPSTFMAHLESTQSAPGKHPQFLKQVQDLVGGEKK